VGERCWPFVVPPSGGPEPEPVGAAVLSVSVAAARLKGSAGKVTVKFKVL